MMNRPTRRVRAAAIGTASLLALAGIAFPSTASAQPLTPAPTAGAPIAAGVTGPVAAEMTAMLKLNPGGIQVSDNAMVWPGGAGTTAVWPSPGQKFAPAGLGSNIRYDVLKSMGIDSVTSEFGDEYGVEAVHGCPSGVTVKDYYCFYTDIAFGGRRLQFTGATSAANAGNPWSFDNQTSSWVNTDTNVIVGVCDGANQTGTILWIEPENSAVSALSTSLNDKLSSWYTA
ncbi:hypothetical protein F1D05_10195 [Kribbella qitaiheensis]|uniref:Uncharacterized protein n=1 Tax=Kribbella qitaiheensis TaxID=1544730 RepID=A0A7G6WW32_9ACTN|nr:peptidase inhibitor family I36 protein [Kribbella qitaiheensis]QNE18197.1 hypothetical protein F1D05_10195 [Kribbella qitaiheensis]